MVKRKQPKAMIYDKITHVSKFKKKRSPKGDQNWTLFLPPPSRRTTLSPVFSCPLNNVRRSSLTDIGNVKTKNMHAVWLKIYAAQPLSDQTKAELSSISRKRRPYTLSASTVSGQAKQGITNRLHS